MAGQWVRWGGEQERERREGGGGGAGIGEVREGRGGKGLKYFTEGISSQHLPLYSFSAFVL